MKQTQKRRENHVDFVQVVHCVVAEGERVRKQFLCRRRCLRLQWVHVKDDSNRDSDGPLLTECHHRRDVRVRCPERGRPRR